MTRDLCLTLVLLTSVTASSAHGDPGPSGEPTEAQKKEALQHLQAGNGHYKAGRYKRAITNYSAGYEATGAPGFLYSLGQAFRLDDNCVDALAHYEKFLEAAPDAKMRESVVSLIAEMRQCVDERRARLLQAPEPSPAGEPGPPTPDLQVSQPERSAPAGKGLGIFGMLTAAAGVAITSAGIYFALDARDASEELSGFANEWGPEQMALESRGERAESRAVVLFVAGGVALAGGVTLYVLGRTSEEGPGERASGVAATPTRGGATVSWSGSF